MVKYKIYQNYTTMQSKSFRFITNDLFVDHQSVINYQKLYMELVGGHYNLNDLVLNTRSITQATKKSYNYSINNILF